MNTPAPHLVRRLRVEFRTAQADAAFRLRQRVADGLQSAAFSRALDTLLARLGPPETTWRIDRLEVPLGEFSVETFEATWMPRLLGAIERSLTDLGSSPGETASVFPKTPPPVGERHPTSEVKLETFAEVLRTGRWPSWAAPLAWPAWETALKTAVRQHPARAAALLAPVLAQPGAAQRLVWQFQKSTVEMLLRHLAGSDVLTRWKREEAALQTAGREAGLGAGDIRERLETARMAFVRALAQRGWVPDEVFFQEIERDFLGFPERLPSANRRLESSATDEPKLELRNAPVLFPSPKPELAEPVVQKTGTELPTSQFIGLAGLVLLHPFLALFFEELGFTGKNDFRTEAARQRAVHVLAHLAGHAPNPPEVALVLPKLLVGFSPETPLPRRIRLSAREKTEARNLLLAVLGHWTALRNTAPEALQTEFLRREGRLDRRDDGWHLTVEQRPADVLLGRLPWGLSLVKLPWMTEWLHVTWA